MSSQAGLSLPEYKLPSCELSALSLIDFLVDNFSSQYLLHLTSKDSSSILIIARETIFSTNSSTEKFFADFLFQVLLMGCDYYFQSSPGFDYREFLAYCKNTTFGEETTLENLSYGKFLLKLEAQGMICLDHCSRDHSDLRSERGKQFHFRQTAPRLIQVFEYHLRYLDLYLDISPQLLP